jgi:hypothetical protein
MDNNLQADIKKLSEKDGTFPFTTDFRINHAHHWIEFVWDNYGTEKRREDSRYLSYFDALALYEEMSKNRNSYFSEIIWKYSLVSEIQLDAVSVITVESKVTMKDWHSDDTGEGKSNNVAYGRIPVKQLNIGELYFEYWKNEIHNRDLVTEIPWIHILFPESPQ